MTLRTRKGIIVLTSTHINETLHQTPKSWDMDVWNSNVEHASQWAPERLEHGCRMIYAGCPSFRGVGLEDRMSCSYFLASTVHSPCMRYGQNSSKADYMGITWWDPY